MRADFKTVCDYIFYKKHLYKTLSIEDKEANIFIFNRYAAKMYPKQAAYLSGCGGLAMDVWYQFFSKENKTPWWWPKWMKSPESNFISEIYPDLRKEDIQWLEINYREEIEYERMLSANIKKNK